MAKKKSVEKELVTEILEDAARDFNAEVTKAIGRIEVSLPRMIFQEKHTSGHLWRKRTWYTYYKYSEGSMIAVPIYSQVTIKAMETK